MRLKFKRWAKIVLLVIAISGFVIYAGLPTYVAEPFFSIPLFQPDSVINELFFNHYQMRSYVARTLVTVDVSGRIYILGGKNRKVRLVVVDQNGRIQGSPFLQLKDGRFLEAEGLRLFAVSPSGNQIWTIYAEKEGRKIVVHNRDGRAKIEWDIKRVMPENVHVIIWDFYAYGEDSAYAVSPYPEVFRFTIGQGKPQRFEMPFEIVYFKDGWFWSSGPLNYLRVRMGYPKQEELKDWGGIAKWTPEKGARIILQLRGVSESLLWIDEEGNFYVEVNGGLNRSGTGVRYRVFSPDGKLLEEIALSTVIGRRREERLSVGQLVKVDRAGIYVEIEKVNEPREYRIVKIVKKRRWQVWWEKLKEAIGK